MIKYKQAISCYYQLSSRRKDCFTLLPPSSSVRNDVKKNESFTTQSNSYWMTTSLLIIKKMQATSVNLH